MKRYKKYNSIITTKWAAFSFSVWTFSTFSAFSLSPMRTWKGWNLTNPTDGVFRDFRDRGHWVQVGLYDVDYVEQPPERMAGCPHQIATWIVFMKSYQQLKVVKLFFALGDAEGTFFPFFTLHEVWQIEGLDNLKQQNLQQFVQHQHSTLTVLFQPQKVLPPNMSTTENHFVSTATSRENNQQKTSASGLYKQTSKEANKNSTPTRKTSFLLLSFSTCLGVSGNLGKLMGATRRLGLVCCSHPQKKGWE